MPSPRQRTRRSSPVVLGFAVDVRDADMTRVISVTTAALRRVDFPASVSSESAVPAFFALFPTFNETASRSLLLLLAYNGMSRRSLLLQSRGARVQQPERPS
jgi:hypothetical protein